MKTKKMYMINTEFIERKAKDGTISIGTFGNREMSVDLVKIGKPFSTAEMIRDIFQRNGWSKFDLTVFHALCSLYDQKEAAGFPKCKVEGIARPFFLEPVENYKKPICEISHLELYRAVTGLSDVASVSPDEFEPIAKSIEKMASTSFTPQRENRFPAFEKSLQKKGIAGISYIHLITAERTHIVSGNRELGYMQLYLKPFLFSYVDAFVCSVNGIL